MTRSLVAIEFPDLEFLPAPGDAVTANGVNVGAVTSADRGYFVGKSIALGYVKPEAAVSGVRLEVTNAAGESRTGVS